MWPAAAAVAAIVFWALLGWHPYPGSWVVKVLPAVFLSLALWSDTRRVARLVALGLLAHGAGDIFLDVDRDRLFIAGMAAFFVGHLLYIAAFRTRPGSEPSVTRTIQIAAVILTAGVIGGILVRLLDGILLYAVPVYVVALTTMTVSAMRAQWPNALVVAGASLFLFSDAVIAVNKFIYPFDLAMWIIWPTYVGGQILIALGILGSADPDTYDQARAA